MATPRRWNAVLAALMAIALLPMYGVETSRAATQATVTRHLTVEHRRNPLGVDVEAPRFGWQMASTRRGSRQTAYQILVSTNPRRLTPRLADVWNSGRVASSDSVAVSYAGPALKPSTRFFWTVRVWDELGRRADSTRRAFFETGLRSTDGVMGWDGAKWIGMEGKEPSSPGAPMLRKQTALTGRAVREARLYISALGAYHAYLNGKRVSVKHDGATTYELMAPGWSNFERTVNYMTYDVTDRVAGAREVTLGAVLGNGWYNGRVNGNASYYQDGGNSLALKAKLLIRYVDGTTQTIVTKPDDGWKATDQGPFVADDIWDGQTYDARKKMRGWTRNGFDASDWAGVSEDTWTTRYPDSKLVAYPGETARIVPQWDRRPRSIVVYNSVAGEDRSPNGRGHIVVDEKRSVPDPDRARAAAVTLRTGDTAILDLGQNIVGVPRYTVSGPKGAEVRFQFGEMLNDASAGADGPEGSVYRANLRAAQATSTYILRGGSKPETHEDSFTFYGFRYATASVMTPDTTVTLHGFTGRVATSAIRDIGRVKTNDALVNKLFRNARWGQRGNYLWVPTDCPQRDERQGWTGDAQLFANTALYNADVTNFLELYSDMMIESQEIYGQSGAEYPVVVPGGFNAIFTDSGVSGWADAGVIVPWTLWQMSGDDSVVNRSWQAMTKYMDWVAERGTGPFAGQGSITGDWLAYQKTSTQFISDAYYAYSTSLMAQMADATGRAADAEKYRELLANIRTTFMAKYLQPDPVNGVRVKSGMGAASPLDLVFGGSIGPQSVAEDDTQTALLWVLKLGFYASETQRQDLVDLLAANIENSPEYQQTHPGTSRSGQPANTLSVGFLGVNVLAPVLTDHDRTDLAYTLLHQDAMPSWLYSVKNGATTVWERWNSYSKEDGFGPVGMNSFNHYSYGAIAEWMYSDMVGIERDPEHPGFRQFILQPHLDPTGKITSAAGSYRSPYGKISSSWSVEAETLTYSAVVPANTRATLRIPTTGPGTVREGASPLAQAPGATFLGFDDGHATYLLESGSYRIVTALR